MQNNQTSGVAPREGGRGVAAPPPILKSMKYKGENEKDKWILGPYLGLAFINLI